MSAIGTTVRIDGQPFAIIGVTPKGFAGVTPGLEPELTIPLTTLKDQEWLRAHASSAVHMLGRVRDGLTIAQANAALQAFWPSVLEATTPSTTPPDRRAMYLNRQTALHSGRAGYSRVRNQFEQPLWMLLALVGLLMAAACASAANLLLARTIARRRELAVRLAIGASRSRLVRQMLTEAMVWTTAAAVVGVGIAAWGASGLVAMMRTPDDRIVIDVSPNWRILSFALTLAFAAAAICSVLPALRASGADASIMIKGAGPAGPLRRVSFSKLLVSGQVALTIVLLVGATLFVRSLYGVLSVDAGMERERVIVVATDARAAGHRGEQLVAFYDRLLDRLRSLPAVESASLSWYPPISDQDGAWTQSVEIDGVAVTPEPTRYVHFNAVTPAYFATLGMRIALGRDFGSNDHATAPRVVAVNEAFARRFFGGQSPLGRRVTIGRNASRRDLEIVAVVSDAKYQRLQEPSRSIAYLPWAQLAERTGARNLHAEVRTVGAPAPVMERLRREVRALDERVPMRVETVNDRIQQSLARERLTALLSAGLGIAALALACAALYGLLSYAVSRQRFEIGLRLALGATRGRILWMVLRDCLLLALAGTVLGLAVSVALGSYAKSLLYELSPRDPLALVTSACLMVAVAVLAALIPARRAATVEPVIALRQD